MRLQYIAKVYFAILTKLLMMVKANKFMLWILIVRVRTQDDHNSGWDRWGNKLQCQVYCNLYWFTPFPIFDSCGPTFMLSVLSPGGETARQDVFRWSWSWRWPCEELCFVVLWDLKTETVVHWTLRLSQAESCCSTTQQFVWFTVTVSGSTPTTKSRPAGGHWCYR